MEVLQCLGELIDDEPHVYVLEYSLADDVMEICFHEFEEQVDIFIVIGADSIVEFDDVGVLELLQNLDLSIGALGVGGVLEGIEDLLQGHHLLGPLILHLPDVAVSARTHLLQHVESTEDMALDEGSVVLRHELNSVI